MYRQWNLYYQRLVLRKQTFHNRAQIKVFSTFETPTFFFGWGSLNWIWMCECRMSVVWIEPCYFLRLAIHQKASWKLGCTITIWFRLPNCERLLLGRRYTLWIKVSKEYKQLVLPNNNKYISEMSCMHEVFKREYPKFNLVFQNQ